tara:strand:+ start:132 stop:599 length:468 start_codon:yes stop_codon:yes gene_type:complete
MNFKEQIMKKYLFTCVFYSFFCINLHAVDFGTKEEAENMLERAVNIIKLDKSMALELFAEGEGGFNYKDLYPFCYHVPTGMMYSHPTFTGLSREKSVAEGVNVADLIINNAEEDEIGSVNIKIARLTTGDKKIYDKTLLITKVDDLACGVGYYKK